MMLIDGRKFCVIGMGKSGIAASNLLAGLGGKVILSDARDTPDLRAVIARSVHREVETVFGTEEIEPGSTVVLSPGISPSRPVFRRAGRIAAEVIGEVELFFRLCPARIVAVTGTDGKSTVTTMIAHLLNTCGINAFAAGNLGNALCELVPRLTDRDVVVAEISCFQLVTTSRFRPEVALVTNLAPDHIEYHGSFNAYVRAKAMVTANQAAGDAFVRNIDDPILRTWFRTDPDTPTCVCDNGQTIADVSQTETHSNGAYLEDGALWVAQNDKIIKICDRSELSLPGPHNTENALMSVMACMMLQDKHVTVQGLRHGLTTYQGLPHRIEFIRELDGVRWYNDSKATNPHAANVGIRSFEGQQLVLLAGGYEKGLELDDMAAAVGECCTQVVLYGACANRMNEEFPDSVPKQIVEDLKAAIEAARGVARPGSVVLLSPGASSFDQFNSFEERGDMFRAIVNGLK